MEHIAEKTGLLKILEKDFVSDYREILALEALQERETIEMLSKKHDVHPNQILRWKKELTENSSKLFAHVVIIIVFQQQNYNFRVID